MTTSLPSPADNPASNPGLTTPETTAPYGEGTRPAPAQVGGGRKRLRIPHLAAMKRRGEKFAMLTAYDRYSAEVFDEAGIPLLLVGDSAGTVVFGEPNTVSITVDELIPLTRAVVGAAPHALVVADLPFGSYQVGPDQALATAVRFFKETGAQAVKLEGGEHVADSVALLVRSGIPVMGHIGFTPQSEHALGGYRVQGRGAGAAQLLADARALQDAGAFAVVLEMVPTTAAQAVTEALDIPTIGIGAGPHCDGQVLVWQDMMGLNTGHVPRFVRRYADLHGVMLDAARAYAEEVRDGAFPAPEHGFDD